MQKAQAQLSFYVLLLARWWWIQGAITFLDCKRREASSRWVMVGAKALLRWAFSIAGWRSLDWKLLRGGARYASCVGVWEKRTVYNFQPFPPNRWIWSIWGDNSAGDSTFPECCVLLDARWLVRWTLAFAFLSPFSPFSVPNLLVTLSTRFADASLKYLRFSREIDWNNFSHTDSFAGWLQKRETRQSRKTNDFSSAALRYAWWSLSEIFTAVANFRYFWWIFMRIFFLHSLSKARITSSLVNNTSFSLTEFYYPEGEN